MTLAARSCPLFGAASISIVPSPRPDDGRSVSQSASSAAVQSQALCVRTSMPAFPPEAPSIPDGTEIRYSQGAPCCATSACCSEMVKTAFRRTGSAFAFTRYAMVPSPCPVCPDTISTQAADTAADQLHSRATVTLTSPLPPAELKFGTVFAMDAWHRAAVGPVTLVTALLPHAVRPAATMANRRALARVVTREANTRCAP